MTKRHLYRLSGALSILNKIYFFTYTHTCINRLGGVCQSENILYNIKVGAFMGSWKKFIYFIFNLKNKILMQILQRVLIHATLLHI